MKQREAIPDALPYLLEELYQLSREPGAEPIVTTRYFSRHRTLLPRGSTVTRDEFPSPDGPCCLFLRLTAAHARVARFAVTGEYRIDSCPSGGWLLTPTDTVHPSYWIPQPPILRTLDAQERVLLEQPAPIVGMAGSPREWFVSVRIPECMHLDLVLWRIPRQTDTLSSDLNNLLSLEKQRTYLWSSKTAYRHPADLYLHLINGYIYQSTRAVPRKWKFCCELDAFELYVWLSGLELASSKQLYNFLRRQIVLSVIARQSADGGWYHGEWTDQKECHYRFHCGALLLLENALDEWDDDAIRESLSRGVSFVAARTDSTDLGLWFLHDSLEESPHAMNEMLKQTGALIKGFGAWKPSHVLGKSATNKMILNTHVDTTVALLRYQEITGDKQYMDRIVSARQATRALLVRRPADMLYRAIYCAVALTLLPSSEGARLPLPLRVVKRATARYLLPQLYRLKRVFPRLVMPSGLIERHLSPLHFDTKYHAVNLLDLARLWRCVPEDELRDVLDRGIDFVMRERATILRAWAEAAPRQFAIVVFAEALYHLCMHKHESSYRRYLAETMLLIEDVGLGLPPSLLGGNAETARRASRVPCPSPTSTQLRIANLSTIDRVELIVVNPTGEDLDLLWETEVVRPHVWLTADGTAIPSENGPLSVPRRGWIRATAGRSAADESLQPTARNLTAQHVENQL